MVWISVLAHKFSGEYQKKGLRHEILGFVRVFRPGTRLLTLGGGGGHNQYFGGTQAPNCTPVAPGQLISFEQQSSLGRHISFLGGTSSDLGAELQNAPS